MASTPEEQARQTIDDALQKAGWNVQDIHSVNVHTAQGVAIREFPLKAGYGTADYLLYVAGKAAGVLEAKKEGTTLSGVEIQAERYSEGMPDELPTHIRPLPLPHAARAGIADDTWANVDDHQGVWGGGGGTRLPSSPVSVPARGRSHAALPGVVESGELLSRAVRAPDRAAARRAAPQHSPAAAGCRAFA